jgi:hypothetical protein
MNRITLLTLAAALAAGGSTLDSNRALGAPDAAPGQGDSVGKAEGQAIPTHLPAGFKLKEKRDDPILIRNAVESITDAAVKGDYKDVVERLVDQDRNRLGKFDAGKLTDLRDAQKRLRDAWKQKFNKDFDFDLDRDRLFAKAFVIQGEVEDPAVAARNWPLPAAGEQLASGRAEKPGKDEGARQAGARSGADGAGGDQLDSNIEKGRDVAVVAFPAAHGLPNLRVSLIQELGGYRVDVPNSVGGEQLYKDLAEHVRQAADSASQWPADAKEAQVAIAHHVLAGVYGAREQGGQGAGAGAGAAQTESR